MRAYTKWLLFGLFVLWIFFVLGSFFAVQKPFSAANVQAAARSLLDLLVAAWLMLVGLGLGYWLLQRLSLDLSLLEQLVFGPALGLGALGLLAFGLGLAGLFNSVVAYGVTLALSALAAPQLRPLARRLRQWQPANRPHPLATLYLALIGLFALSLALLPPSDWDGLFYHLTGPKIYLQAGQITGGIDVPHLSFPALMEMLFAWAMLLRSDVAAKLLHAGFGLLLVGLVYAMTRRLFGKKAAWPAVLVLASMPMLGTLAAWAYNDLALAFYQLAALYAVVNDQLSMNNEQLKDRPSSVVIRHPYLILSGLFAGLAMGLKYTSFVTPLVIAGLILATRPSSFALRPSSLITRHSVYRLTLFAVIACITAAPWYLKNWIFTGNPVYPFLYSIFGGQFWDSFRAGWYAAAGTGIGWRPTTLLALPWLLTLGVRDANFWDGRTGPLLLLFLPVVLISGIDWLLFGNRKAKIEKPKSYNLLLIYLLAHFIFWTAGVIWSRSLWQSRLLLPGLAGLAPLAGWAWSQLPRFDLPQFSLSRFVNIAIGLTLLLTVIDVGLLTLKIDPLPYLAGLESRDEYLTRRLGAHYAAMQQINEQLPAEATVLFLWEPRSYYCRLACRPDTILAAFPHLVHRYGSAQAMARAWHAAGVSHILIHRTGLEFMLDEQPDQINQAVLAKLETDHLLELFDVAGAYQLYVLKVQP